MTNWKINSGIIIGTEHVFAKSNRQDFCKTISTKKGIFGIVCDGCSSTTNAEVGSALLGRFALKTLHQLTFNNVEEYKLELQSKLENFLKCLTDLMADSESDKVDFIQNYLLTTMIFCVVIEDKIIVGYAGDGIIIVETNETKLTNRINQNNYPHYLAYNIVPKEYLLAIEPNDIVIEEYSVNDVKSIVIATDGLDPLFEKKLIDEVYRTSDRQLQRKFNIWQNKKMFSDDVSCIVFEKDYEGTKLEETNEHSESENSISEQID
jgi:serine/threonine protein phosphatase PrpC